ncbi:MAG: nucleoside deaminase, partial [Bifidobacterium crudilactis]|nr:nucleoside deaminase [Bifidobacterium crudilactis]
DIPRDPHIGAMPEVIGGIKERECTELLNNFFQKLR